MSIAIDDNVSTVQIRAQWSYRSLAGGESSWSFICLRAGGDQRALVMGMWEEHCMPYFIAARPVSWRLDRILAEDRWPNTLAPLVDDVRLEPDPPGTGHGLPPQCSPLISWRSGEPGRRNRGRTYMGPYTVDSCEEYNVTGDGDAAVSDFAESMMATFTGAIPPSSPHFAIVSRLPTLPLSPHGTYALVSTYYYLARWAVVARRMQFDWRT